MGKNTYKGTELKRNILKELDKWSKQSKRRSLILRGARQVGKTWTVREFAKESGISLVEINFERQVRLRAAFDGDLTPDVILTNIELMLGISIDHHNSLLFLDEVQDCPRAITALKHFTDAMHPIRVIAAGSYLGLIEGKGEGVSQPIGYVDELTMYPMSFEEFACAVDAHQSLQVLVEYGSRPTPAAHDRLMALLRDYLFVGGMPQVVETWRTQQPSESVVKRLEAIRTIQKDLLTRYKADFAKYYPRDALNIGRTWELVAEQLAKSFEVVKRFTFKDQLSGKRDFKGFGNYFSCLEACGLIHRSYIIEHPVHPLKAQKRESFFKCYFFDTGLLCAELDIAYTALQGDSDIPFKGPIAENFLACVMARLKIPTFCYLKANSSAEIEFVVQRNTAIIPLEVKNNDTRAKSLSAFVERYHPPFVIKFSSNIGNVQDKVRHYPLYQAGACLERDILSAD